MKELIVLGASLVAILTLALAAKLLGLGGGRIGGETEAIRAAEDILSGFDGESATIGSDGQAAIVRGRDGSFALLKMHGARIAARRLTGPLDAVPTGDGLRIASGEARFGTVLVRGIGAL
ncbi:hypothetical protein P1X14_21605 [Sphingomonas sp. AOB5]|uniref:hypothetical protein n=1 Tax=Sphingomonas sp. AOB5 TaxID=3034017 RepID=UPI0023F725DD|nr:hypothetical protein [Sphingomonas sp. AOB5]MDF7777866.1 hypothetical protein [Sphingomonas sp. AOB5]